MMALLSWLVVVVVVVVVTFELVEANFFHSPASLLFPPTTRSPDVSCDFDPASGCSGWLAWPVDEEISTSSDDLSTTSFPLATPPQWPAIDSLNYRIRSEKTPDASTFNFLSVEKRAKMYVMSSELTFTTTTTSTSKTICFSYYYRLMSILSGTMKAFIMVTSRDDGQYPALNWTLVWNETGKWPTTWNWLANTVQLTLPKNTTKAVVVFYLDAGDGIVALDDVEMFTTNCNLRPTPPQNGSGISKTSGSDSASTARVWPSPTIPYEIGIGFSAMQQIFIKHALQGIKLHTCVSFVRHTNESHYVQFIHTSEGCTSQRIGFTSGRHFVHLADNCFDKSTLTHEILHVVGLYHEHQRPERDNYITVVLANVDPSYREQFTKYTTMDGRLTSVAYDYGSVMHYRETAFAARRGLKTMVAKNASSPVTIGNLQGPVRSDYQKVANLYCDGQVKSTIEPRLPKSPPFRPPLWDNGDIPVEFDDNFSSEQVAALQEVMDEMNIHTCLRFKPRTNESDYVYFQLTNSECYARSGRLGGRQVVTVYPGSCFSRALLFWLVLHVAGLDAEHRRPDRDENVDVRVENIAEEHRESFQKFESMDWRILSIPYDTESVLHYSSTAFAKSPYQPTIVAKENASLVLGNKIGPTALDYAKIVRLYNCSYQYWKDLPKSPLPPGVSRFLPSVLVPLMATAAKKAMTYPATTPGPLPKMIPNLWPDKAIPFQFNEHHFTIFEGRRIFSIIKAFNRKSCLQFLPRTNETDFVEIVKADTDDNDNNNNTNSSSMTVAVGSSCRSSYFGRKGGRQTITLPNSKCFTTTYYIYLALLGTAGLTEEHRRPSRDRYVNILWDNMVENARIYFVRYAAIDSRLESIDYDINSLTHFWGDAFAKQPGLKTMLARTNSSLPLGNPTEPTNLDYKKIAALYCP